MQNKSVVLKSILAYNGLSSGHSFRDKIKHTHNGSLRVIQLKDFEENYTVIGNDCVLVDGEKIKTKNYLENGDVLFISKGANNFAVSYMGFDDIPTIASSALFVLKINKNLANPDFVAWYINQSKVQNYFKTNEAGTYTTSINKATIEHAPIILPSLEMQTKIAKIANLHNQELVLNNKIIELKNKLTTAQLLNIL
ncbi:restriction endonuclease subunit S [Subsaximicrobium wynnwilliamsii]|uniref:Restriction endonuclease subunit S n=1 Tax=Subsaximicrobium wynnwilliamsii TaxID=291179 RepID=A0A5C6ZMR6_9FLAO|nr:restriction endonuclease subunit S [Subsaximicrobium wynnwilliamsii]TXD84940.1 restriction endonuclease subunit S [Subsaximicrobium wynnwilliamsii]TXD90611.1 restriction endonuclease subunit S [Subsaximicrobium wynnwilliamsii]TXE05085.1 restriction endonuclease subunit S [Subsaximicrobium wynnwilliamsii]